MQLLQLYATKIWKYIKPKHRCKIITTEVCAEATSQPISAVSAASISTLSTVKDKNVCDKYYISIFSL